MFWTKLSFGPAGKLSQSTGREASLEWPGMAGSGAAGAGAGAGWAAAPAQPLPAYVRWIIHSAPVC